MKDMPQSMPPIGIKKSHEGKFTEWAKKHGFKTVQEAASHVMANKGKYSKDVIMMANFAKNAQSFSHTPMMNQLKKHGGM